MNTDNPTYNVVAILHNKMKGVAAYQEYQKDFEGNQTLKNLLEEIQQNDERHIEQLEQELGRMLQGQEGSAQGATTSKEDIDDESEKESETEGMGTARPQGSMSGSGTSGLNLQEDTDREDKDEEDDTETAGQAHGGASSRGRSSSRKGR